MTETGGYRIGEFISFNPVAFCSCIPGHRVSLLAGACIDCGYTEREYLEQGNRACPGPPEVCEELEAAA